MGKVLFFRADDGTHGNEPWVTYGTPAGTRLLDDIFPGPADSDSGNDYEFVAAALPDPLLFGDLLIFPANDGVHGAELWQAPI